MTAITATTNVDIGVGIGLEQQHADGLHGSAMVTGSTNGGSATSGSVTLGGGGTIVIDVPA